MLREFCRRIMFLFARERLFRELKEEMQLHREMGSANETGVASRGFGNATRWIEISREVWVTAWLDALVQDMRFGLRQLVRNRGVTVTIAISLALGLGATLAMFSLLNALLFKALPVPEPQSLIVVMHGTASDHGPSMSYPAFVRLQEQSRSLAELFAIAGSRAQFSDGSMERKVWIEVVSGNFYSALQVRPQLGRLLEPANDQRGGLLANTVVLSDRFWRQSFHADPRAVGRKILLDGLPFVVVGVAPQDFFGVSPGTYPDLTITFAATMLLNPKNVRLDCWQCNSTEVMGRLKKNVSISQAQAALRVAWQSVVRDSVSKDAFERFSNTFLADQLFLDPGGSGPGSYLRSSFVKPLYLLLTMSGLILLAACSNVANLLLARAQARQRELAVRLSTGASRRRIVQQFLTESSLLALIGLGGAIAVYLGCVRGLLLFMQRGGSNVVLDTRPDTRLLLFAGALLVLAILLFGLLPAVRASRAPLRTPLAESSQNIAGKSKLGRAILAIQIAVSFILLSGAVLLARSLYDLRNFDAGFRRDHLLIASPEVTKVISGTEDQARFAARVVSRLETLPGVRLVSASALLPADGTSWAAEYLPEGFLSVGKKDAECYLNYVSPGFFATMGTSLLLGRDFTARDERPGSPAVGIVSQSFARHFWGKDNPLGKRIRDTAKGEPITVIGVARDARHRSFWQPAPRTVYLRFPAPPVHGLMWDFHVEVWTHTNPEALIGVVRQIFHEENSRVPLELQTFDVLLDRRLLYERLLTAIALAYGTSGALLAAIGAYGTAAYSTSKRTLEVGIRASLGATRPQIMRLFVREYLFVGWAGLAAGVLGSWSLTGFLQSWLFGVSPKDLPSFAACAGFLVTVSAIAILIPAARAVRIEPWQALRRE